MRFHYNSDNCDDTGGSFDLVNLFPLLRAVWREISRRKSSRKEFRVLVADAAFVIERSRRGSIEVRNWFANRTITGSDFIPADTGAREEDTKLHKVSWMLPASSN